MPTSRKKRPIGCSTHRFSAPPGTWTSSLRDLPALGEEVFVLIPSRKGPRVLIGHMIERNGIRYWEDSKGHDLDVIQWMPFVPMNDTKLTQLFRPTFAANRITVKKYHDNVKYVVDDLPSE